MSVRDYNVTHDVCHEKTGDARHIYLSFNIDLNVREHLKKKA